MGTRGMLALAANRREMYQYVQFDSYPGGWPKELLEYVRTRMAEDPEKFLAQVRNVRVLTEDVCSLTEQEQADLLKYADTRVGSGSIGDAYVLLRGCQGQLDKVLESGFILHQQGWPEDSLFCEYGYLIDADKMTFEAYKGFQQKPHRKGRFGPRKMKPTAEEIRVRDEMRKRHPGYSPDLYYPVALKGEWPLTGLPTYEQMERAIDAGEDGYDADGNPVED